MTAARVMRGQLEGKVALVTGGSSGIGRAAALLMAREGAHVVVWGRGEPACRETVDAVRSTGASAEYVLVDVTEEEDVRLALEHLRARHGGLDIAFNNAGAWSYAPLDEVSADTWHAQLELNLTSVFFAVKHEIAALRGRGGASIINNASVAGLVGSDAGLGPYAAAKHGVIGLTKAAALELAGDAIRVNAIAPGVVDTPRFRQEQGATSAGAQLAAAAHPVGRIATAEEVAGLVLYLASDAAAFVTGAVLPIDGGYTTR